MRLVSEKAGVPHEIINRRDKVGFATPFNYWFDDELKNWKKGLIAQPGANLLVSKVKTLFRRKI